MYCQRHRPTPPPGYGGIAFGENAPEDPLKKAEIPDAEESALLPVRILENAEYREKRKDEVRPSGSAETEEKTTENGPKTLLNAFLREKWSFEDLVTVLSLLLIVSGQADDGILLLVGLLLVIGGEGSL